MQTCTLIFATFFIPTLSFDGLRHTRSLSDATSSFVEEVMKVLKKEAKEIFTDLIKGGAVFTRWGRTVCPRGNDVVYKGVAGGNSHTRRAGPSNTLCLPNDPEYDNYTTNNHGQGHISGVEYESTIHFMKHLVNHDVPCVVCRSLSRRSVVMVPAKMTCHHSWHREYKGYLMSGSYNQASSQYMCLDGQPETVYRGYENKQGQLLYLVEAVCGSLPCPPYKMYGELTCVVCSK